MPALKEPFEFPVGEGPFGGEPSLWAQTVKLGTLLRTISDRDPAGNPSPIAETAFRAWLTAAEPKSEDPRYFVDIADNYDIQGRSNRDLFDVFELLHPYVEIGEPDEEVSPARMFLSLPTISD